MPTRFGITGPIRDKVNPIRKAIVGGLLAGVSSALATAQASNADGVAVSVGGLLVALVSGFAVWWTRNVDVSVDVSSPSDPA